MERTIVFIFFQAEDGRRDWSVTGVQMCFFFQAEDGIRDWSVMEFRRVLFRSDGMDYEEQIRNLWKQRMECQKQARRIGKPLEHLTAAEYLSRFRKNDRLIPIISLVFYYGSDPWDGPQDLYDMFRLEGSEEEKVVLEKYLPNYKINLVDAERMNEQEIKYFSEDLQVILTMLKYRHEKNELKEYINKQKRYFQNVDYETSQVIKVFLNMKSIPGETDERKVNVNMCEALEEMYNDAIKEGMEAGTKRKLIEQVMKKVKKELFIPLSSRWCNRTNNLHNLLIPNFFSYHHPPQILEIHFYP